MPRSLQDGDRPVPLQSLELPLVGAARRSTSLPTTFQDSEAQWLMPLVAAAIDATMARQEAGILMGVDGSTLTKNLKGEGHLSVRRLGVLPVDFWGHFATALRVHFGLLNKAELIEQANDLSIRARHLYAKAASL